MVKKFEEITSELTEEEHRLMPLVIKGLSTKTADSPVTGSQIVEAMKAKGYNMSEPRLRKIINYIRANGMLPLMASSNGYYVSDDTEEIANQVQSLRERALAINAAAKGLKKFLDAGAKN